MIETGNGATAAADAAAVVIAGLDAVETLDRLSANRRAREAAEVDDLQCALHWAGMHGAVEVADGRSALPGAEELIRLGGEGTPEVAEFAPAEFGAELGISPSGATLLIGDALDLAHRLPRLWRRVRTGEVKPFVGRQVAQATRSVSAAAVALVDARIAPWADRLTWPRLERIVEAAVIAADPAQAEIDARAAESAQGVWLGRDHDHGVRDIHIRTDAASALEFDAALSRVADDLAELGDVDPRDVRRAKAVGVLAHPQQALDLFDRAAGRPVEARPTASLPAATLYLHVTPDCLASAEGVVRAEGIGPITVGQARRWIGHRQVTVKPVIDLAGIAPVDAYEIPDRLREAVRLLSPADAFPYASSTGRVNDLDHTIPYRSPDNGGPPGQTGLGSLAPLTRRHHRIKTHGRWQVRQPFPGVLVWRSPHGRLYLVDHTGTRRADCSSR